MKPETSTLKKVWWLARPRRFFTNYVEDLVKQGWLLSRDSFYGDSILTETGKIIKLDSSRLFNCIGDAVNAGERAGILRNVWSWRNTTHD